MAVKGTYGMGIDKSRDQELSSGQMQPLEVPGVTNGLQERIRGRGRCRRNADRDLIYRFDDTIMADVDARARDDFARAPVDGGDESAGDEESHMTIWDREFKCGTQAAVGMRK